MRIAEVLEQQVYNMNITAILAMTHDGLIGNNNMLAWHIPEDLVHFRKKTKNSVVIMGRNTFFSLPEKFRPLPDRRNIVFTHTNIEWVECVDSVEELEVLLQNEKRKIFLIGGAQLYNYFFKNELIDHVELTLLDGDFAGNVYIDDFREKFFEVSREKFSQWYFISLRHKKYE